MVSSTSPYLPNSFYHHFNGVSSESNSSGNSLGPNKVVRNSGEETEEINRRLGSTFRDGLIRRIL